MMRSRYLDPGTRAFVSDAWSWGDHIGDLKEWGCHAPRSQLPRGFNHDLHPKTKSGDTNERNT